MGNYLVGRVRDAARRAGRKIGLLPTPVKEVPASFRVFMPGVRQPECAIGRALMTYLCDPFVTDPASSEFRRHANFFQCIAVADELAARGYVVDATHWRNPSPPSGSDYDVVFGLGPAFSACAANRQHGALAVYFGTGAVANQTNLMQVRRDAEFNKRHLSQVSTPLHDDDTGPALADRLLVTGDDWVVGTYAGYSPAPVSVCPNPVVQNVVCTVGRKDFLRSRKHFIWMAAYGGLRRRLDLVLEAFSVNPDLHLWVCGGIRHEKKLYSLLRPWLTNFDNIHEVGWVDVGSSEFSELTSRCAFLIYPSSSDGVPGSVVNLMASGVVPLVTREAGIDVGSFGWKIVAESAADIVEVIRAATLIPPEEVRRMAVESSVAAEEDFSQGIFKEKVRACFDDAGLARVRDPGRAA